MGTTPSYPSTPLYFLICLFIPHPIITKFHTCNLVVSVNIVHTFFGQELCCVMKAAKVWFVMPANKCWVGVFIHDKNGKCVASHIISISLVIND